VVGLAVARALALRGMDVIVAEAASQPGSETSSRNSGVIHAGLYYPPGSLRARLCVSGRDALYDYARRRGVGHRACGKLVVATGDDQLPALAALAGNAEASGAGPLQWLDGAALRGLEPELHAQAALLSPATGIIDTQALVQALQADLEDAGGSVALRSPVRRVASTGGLFRLWIGDEAEPVAACRRLVNAAGLQAQSVARAIEPMPLDRIPPRHLALGRYYALAGRAPFSRLVYPLPPGGGGLGIHLVLDLEGGACFGPDLRWIDRIDYGFGSPARDEFAAAIHRYWPELDPARLTPAFTGIRPKLSGPGEPVADFMIQGASEHGVTGLVNLFGIDSPGLTAALAIAEEVAARL
jgi:L-2-hydroxyglutarate oxidase LhgO